MEKQQSGSQFVVVVIAIVATCAGIGALGLRHRREEVARLAGVTTDAPLTPPPAPQVAAPEPDLISDPTAQPVATIRGKIIFDENRQMIVTDEDSEKESVFSQAQLEQQVLRFHRDDAQKVYWLDLTDGRRVDLDEGSAATLARTLPNRFTYGESRSGDAPPPMVGADSPN